MGRRDSPDPAMSIPDFVLTQLVLQLVLQRAPLLAFSTCNQRTVLSWLHGSYAEGALTQLKIDKAK